MTPTLYMDALITPARSMSPRGQRIVLGITIALALVPAITFSLMGAHLVVPFLGLDILGLWFAFRVINRRVQAERVKVSTEAVEVLRNDRQVWTSPTAFTRVDEFETAVRLAVSGRRTSVARALSPDERHAFAHALDKAIRSARAERYPGSR